MGFFDDRNQIGELITTLLRRFCNLNVKYFMEIRLIISYFIRAVRARLDNQISSIALISQFIVAIQGQPTTVNAFFSNVLKFCF